MTTIFNTQKYDTFTVSPIETNKDNEENREGKGVTDVKNIEIVTPHTPIERVKYYEQIHIQSQSDDIVSQEELPSKEESVTKYIYLEDKGTFYDTTTDIEYVKSDIFRRKLSIEFDKKITDDEVRYMIKSGEIQKKKGIIWSPREREGYYNRFNSKSIIQPSHTPILDEGIDILLSSISGHSEENKEWLHKAIFYKWANFEDVRVPCVVLYGTGGSGKSTMIELLKGIFGDENVVGNLRQGELTGNFDTVVGDKLVYEFSEITAFNSNIDKQMLSRVKNLVFAPTITVQRKYKNPFQHGNYAWFFLTSNAMRPLIFDNEESGNRRFVAFRSRTALTAEEAEKVYNAINNHETLANYLAWLHQEYSEVLSYKEMYRIENDDMRLLVQNSNSEIDEISAILRDKYQGQRVHIKKVYTEIEAFAEMNKQSYSHLTRLFKAQSPFMKGKGTIEGVQGSQYFYEIV